jgi:hypothetical protein
VTTLSVMPRTSILCNVFRLCADLRVASVVCCIDVCDVVVRLSCTPAPAVASAGPRLKLPLASTCQLCVCDADRATLITSLSIMVLSSCSWASAESTVVWSRTRR